jgi:hypothetical protein
MEREGAAPNRCVDRPPSTLRPPGRGRSSSLCPMAEALCRGGLACSRRDAGRNDGSPRDIRPLDAILAAAIQVHGRVPPVPLAFGWRSPAIEKAAPKVARFEKAASTACERILPVRRINLKGSLGVAPGFHRDPYGAERYANHWMAFLPPLFTRSPIGYASCEPSQGRRAPCPTKTSSSRPTARSASSG